MIIRSIIIFFIAMSLLLLGLQLKLIDRRFLLPAWYKTDTIASRALPVVTLTDRSGMPHTDAELRALEQDYHALWTHLDYLWSTGDVDAGKEYYTEAWFSLLSSHNPQSLTTGAWRKTWYHHFTVLNWSADGLVCAGIDSNVLSEYHYHSSAGKDSCMVRRSTFAVALLFQGDHWRIDGLLDIEDNLIPTNIYEDRICVPVSPEHVHTQ